MLCFFINIFNLKKINIQKGFFSKQKIPVQHTRFLSCVVHKVHMAQNIIFKGIVLLQIYIPMHKKNKYTTFAPFSLSKSSQVKGHFQTQRKF